MWPIRLTWAFVAIAPTFFAPTCSRFPSHAPRSTAAVVLLSRLGRLGLENPDSSSKTVRRFTATGFPSILQRRVFLFLSFFLSILYALYGINSPEAIPLAMLCLNHSGSISCPSACTLSPPVPLRAPAVGPTIPTKRFG